MNYLTLRESAEYTGLAVDTLRRYIKLGRLSAMRRGPKIIVIAKADLDALLSPR